MKKFTLLMAAAFVSIAGSAQIAKKCSEFKSMTLQNKFQQTLPSQYNMKYLTADFDKQQADQKLMQEMRDNRQNPLKPFNIKEAYQQSKVSKAPSDENWDLALHSGVIFGEFMEYFAPYTFNQGIYQKDGNDLYVDFYFGLQPVKGTISKVDNMLSSYGADSITFVNGQIVGATKSGVQYGLYLVDVGINAEQNGYTVSKNTTDATFGGYYFPENGELFLPGIAVGVYPVQGTELYATTCYGDIDLMPAQPILENMYLAQIEKVDDEGQVETEDSALVAIDDEYMYITDLSWFGGSKFLMLSYDVETMSAALKNYQYLDTRSISEAKGGGSIEFYNCAFTPADDEHFSSYQSGFGFFMESDPATDNLILTSDGLSYACEVGLSDNKDFNGIFNLYTEVNVTVTSERIFSGIDGVKDNASKVVATEYFDAMGRKTTANAKGLVVKKERMANGLVKSTKFLK